MINIEIEGRLPNFDNFTFANSFDKISKHLETSIKMNFAEGGRPTKWKTKKNGEPSHLFIDGTLFDSIGSDFGEDFAEAGAMSLLPYSFAHQFGYSPRNLPPREYVMFQQEDIDFAINTLGTDLLTFFQTKGEPI
jgi:phage gpG-like protein